MVSLAHLLINEGWTCSYRLCGRSRLRPSSGVSVLFALLSGGCHARLRTFTHFLNLALPHSLCLYSWPECVAEAVKEILSNFRGTRRYIELVGRSLLPEWDVRGNPRYPRLHCWRKGGRRRWRRFGTQRRRDVGGARTTDWNSSAEEKSHISMYDCIPKNLFTCDSCLISSSLTPPVTYLTMNYPG